ncbi:MAG: hypothetical protein Q8M29_13610 [Bacteroidota bacterium]|nr:hypothetical protein [Bacteroidota bacterium]
MKNLTIEETKAAKEIISQGLIKAAESLSFFMKEKIALSESDFTISNNENITLKVNSVEELFVLVTEMKGEMRGTCFLVFNQEEKDEICKMALPPEIYHDSAKLCSMQEPLLLEVDNIISASVITQIANQLKKKIYGDVPRLTLMSKDSLKKMILQQMEPNNFIIGFQTEFVSSKSHFHPEFFWILEPDFLKCVRNEIL